MERQTRVRPAGADAKLRGGTARELLPGAAAVAVMLLAFSSVDVAAGEPSEPDDSPLFGSSLQGASGMLVERDTAAGLLSKGAAVQLNATQVLMVERDTWHVVNASGLAPKSEVSLTVNPRISTMDGIRPNCGPIPSVTPTYSCVTCSGATCTCANCSLHAIISAVQVLGGTNVQIHLQSQSDLLYRLHACTNLAAPIWVEVTSGPGSGGRLVLTHTNTAFAPRLFYRIQSQCK